MARKYRFPSPLLGKPPSLVALLMSLCCAFWLPPAHAAASVFRCSGAVMSDNGDPVIDAVVECYGFLQDPLIGAQIPNLQTSTRTDRNGRFVFGEAASRYFLLVRKPGFAPAWELANEPSEKEHHLVLSPPGTFSGVVLDRGKKPVADAEVWVAWASDLGGAARGRFWESILAGPLAKKSFSTHSSADGKFQISGFPRTARGLLAARKDGLASAPTTSSSESWFAGGISAAASATNVQIVVEATGSIEGQVTIGWTEPYLDFEMKSGVRQTVVKPGNPGAPVTKGIIVLVPMSETWAESPRTNTIAADGRVRFPDVAAGHYRLFGIAENDTNSDLIIPWTYCSLTTGQAVTNLPVRAAPAGTLEVLVRSKEDSKPLSGAALTVDERHFISGPDGSCLIRVAAGSCSLHVQKLRFQEKTFSAKVVAGQTNRVEFALAHLPTITGIVLGPSGEPVGHAQVTGFLREPSPEFQTESRPDGTFELPWHPAYDRQITHFSGVVVRDVTHGLAGFVPLVPGNRHLEVRLVPGLTISGEVRDSTGQPLPQVRVLARWEENVLLPFPATSGTDGSYDIKALPPGHAYTVLASTYHYNCPRPLSVPASQSGLIKLPALELQPWPQSK